MSKSRFSSFVFGSLLFFASTSAVTSNAATPPIVGVQGHTYVFHAYTDLSSPSLITYDDAVAELEQRIRWIRTILERADEPLIFVEKLYPHRLRGEGTPITTLIYVLVFEPSRLDAVADHQQVRDFLLGIEFRGTRFLPEKSSGVYVHNEFRLSGGTLESELRFKNGSRVYPNLASANADLARLKRGLSVADPAGFFDFLIRLVGFDPQASRLRDAFRAATVVSVPTFLEAVTIGQRSRISFEYWETPSVWTRDCSVIGGTAHGRCL